MASTSSESARLLEDVAQRAGAERGARVRRLVLHRQHDDLRLRNSARISGIAVQARPAWHIEVEHEHVRMMPPHVSSGVLDIASLRHDLEATSMSSTWRRPRRTTAWSSAITTRIVRAKPFERLGRPDSPLGVRFQTTTSS